MTGPVFPQDSWVQVRYPLTREYEHADRAGWPWLPGWVRASRQDRDRAILAADAGGYTAAAISQSFGLSRTSVSRVLFRDADRRS